MVIIFQRYFLFGFVLCTLLLCTKKVNKKLIPAVCDDCKTSTTAAASLSSDEQNLNDNYSYDHFNCVDNTTTHHHKQTNSKISKF